MIRTKIISSLEKVFGKELTFATCTTSSAQMLAIREAVNDLIKSKLNA